MSKRIDDLIKENSSPNGEIINLREKYLGLRGIMEVASNPVLKNVKELILPGNQCADEGAEAIAQSPYLENLESLNLNHNEIGDEGAIAIANSDKLPKLTSLSMFGNVIGDVGAKAFAQSPISKK
ncbi:uncharacterized protein METZ01_LOCUS372198, partial [marine metagenome]